MGRLADWVLCVFIVVCRQVSQLGAVCVYCCLSAGQPAGCCVCLLLSVGRSAGWVLCVFIVVCQQVSRLGAVCVYCWACGY